MKLKTRLLVSTFVLGMIFIGVIFLEQNSLGLNSIINSLSIALIITLLYNGNYEIMKKGRKFKEGRISGFFLGLILGAAMNAAIYLSKPEFAGSEILSSYRGIFYPLSLIIAIGVGPSLPLLPKIDSVIYHRVETVREYYDIDK